MASPLGLVVAAFLFRHLLSPSWHGAFSQRSGRLHCTELEQRYRRILARKRGDVPLCVLRLQSMRGWLPPLQN